MTRPLPPTVRAADPTDPHVRDFCGIVAPSGQLHSLTPTPQPDAPANECFTLVNAAVEQHGGARVDGWAIWERPGVLLEAEFHAVWENSVGSLLDLSPLTGMFLRGATRTFLVDPDIKYAGVQVNSRRFSLTNNQAAIDLIAARDAKYELLNRGERAKQHGDLRLSGVEADEYRRIAAAELDAELRLSTRYVLRSAPCPCLSGSQYSKCHGRS